MGIYNKIGEIYNMGKLKELFMSREIDREDEHDGKHLEDWSNGSPVYTRQDFDLELEQKLRSKICPCTFGICSECEYYEEET